jgi:hypothetical protein
VEQVGAGFRRLRICYRQGARLCHCCLATRRASAPGPRQVLRTVWVLRIAWLVNGGGDLGMVAGIWGAIGASYPDGWQLLLLCV